MEHNQNVCLKSVWELMEPIKALYSLRAHVNIKLHTRKPTSKQTKSENNHNLGPGKVESNTPHGCHFHNIGLLLRLEHEPVVPHTLAQS